MKVLIIEDEMAAAQNLQAILRNIDSNIKVVDTLDTIVSCIEFFNVPHELDLIFMDIHLSDGDSFEIFKSVSISTPIIFTTAYDQYALEAFKVSSIDYLLKPIVEDELRRAIEKWKMLTTNDRDDYHSRMERMLKQRGASSETFLVHFRDKIIPLQYGDIAFCYTADEKVWAYDRNGNRYLLEFTLEMLQNMLPMERFFRANRQYIISRDSVKDVSIWIGSRLKLNLVVEVPEKIIISKAKVAEFKAWLKVSN
ncbi:MAG: response regulator transcription factor [Alistipes sp.]|nr:response regulator transcription factor [Candidatus Alistipes equi]